MSFIIIWDPVPASSKNSVLIILLTGIKTNGVQLSISMAHNPVRSENISSQMQYWAREYFDGFRIDATQQIFDASEKHY